jgi:hypothetical protein
VTPSDRESLDAYIGGLAALRVSKYNRAEQLAYWINLYNALTVRLILDHYPVASIRDIDISPGLLADGPWNKDLVTVEGQRITLNDIEHRILRPIWNDPRLHYALNCAPLGCPNLRPAAFTADNANQLMGRGARDFINTRVVQVIGGRLIVSSVYAWFTEDFGSARRGCSLTCEAMLRPPLAARPAAVRKIDGDAYDWRLNDAGQK